MAIVYVEGFDLVGSNNDLTAKGMSRMEGTYLPTGGINGGGAMQLGTSDDILATINLPFIRYTTVSFWFKAVTIPAFEFFFALYEQDVFNTTEADLHVHVAYGSTGNISVYGDSQATLLGTSAGVHFLANTWHYVEVLIDSNTSGNVEVIVDGVSAISVAGDTQEGSTAANVVFVGSTVGHNIDDIIIQTDSGSQPAALGLTEIETLLPDGAGTNSAWTGTFADVDDALNASSDGDTTTITESVLNDKHDFTLGNLSGSPTTIHAIQQTIEARKDDVGLRGVTPFVISNAVTGNGTELTLAQPFAQRTHLLELDPDGAAAWTVSSVNALQVGVEITT